MPGVRQAGLTTSVPLADAGAIFYSAEGMTAVDATNRPRAYVQRVTPGYFETLGMRIVEGRDFTLDRDGRREHGGDRQPQASSIASGRGRAASAAASSTAISRADSRGSRSSAWSTKPTCAAFRAIRPPIRICIFPFNQRARVFAVLLRTDGDPAARRRRGARGGAADRAGRGGLQRADARALVATQLAPARFSAGSPARLPRRAHAGGDRHLRHAVVLGAAAHAEIGIRAALGADRGALLSLVVGQAMTMAAVGVVVGAVLAAGLTRFIETQLYAVQPMDWMSFAAPPR